MNKRLLSLDVMRGLIMILLAAESAGVYSRLWDITEHGLGAGLVEQFFHHPWHGLRFWDLIQPGFMTIAGTALFLSYSAKASKGISWRAQLPQMLRRCLRLFVLGVALHCVYSGKLVWELWNVLTQLAFTLLIAFFIVRTSYTFQLVFSLGLLLLTELLYRTVLVPPFTEPFELGKNFGAYIDSIVMGKINDGGWVFINFIPTAAHTIWGALAGKLLLDDRLSSMQKCSRLGVAGLVLLVLGYGLDITHVSPIIKRICTSSFVLASAGWILLGMAALYWIVDYKGNNKYAWVFSVVGMNAIFIYLFFETVGHQWLNGTVSIFIFFSPLLAALVTLFLEWWLCYYLYQKKIFFRL